MSSPSSLLLASLGHVAGSSGRPQDKQRNPKTCKRQRNITQHLESHGYEFMAYEKAYGLFLSVAVFSLEVVVGFSEHELRIRQFVEVHPAFGLRSDNTSSRSRSNGITVLVFDNLKSLQLAQERAPHLWHTGHPQFEKLPYFGELGLQQLKSHGPLYHLYNEDSWIVRGARLEPSSWEIHIS